MTLSHPDDATLTTDAGAARSDRYPPQDVPPPLPSRYDPLVKIGEGGMGEVWRVTDRQFNRPLAVKVMLPHIVDNRQAVVRFEREAELTGSLQHPAIPPVVDRGTLEDGAPFFSMKLVEGETLASLLKERPCDDSDDLPAYLPRLLSIFDQVCQAVGYAHSQEIIHRDLKPANIMVGAFGEVQVMDWGMAKRHGADRETAPPDVPPIVSHLDVPPDREATIAHDAAAEDTSPISETVSVGDASEGDAGLTRAGTVLGTLAYMPPEQARGEVDLLDCRSDVFGLGAILCEILIGRPPYRGSSAWLEAASGHPGDAFDLLERSSADQELVDLCKRCLAAEAALRPPDASAVAEEIRRYEETVRERLEREKTDRAAAETKAIEEHKRAKVERSRRMLTAAVATLLLVLAIGGPVAALHQRRLAGEATKQHESADRERDKARRALRQSQRNLAGALLRRGVSQLQSGSASAGLWDLWRAYDVAAGESDLRDSALNLMAGWRLIPQAAFQNPWNRQVAAFSPDRNFLLTTSGEDQTNLWSVHHAAPTAKLNLGTRLNTAIFSRDGRILLTGGEDGTARLWDATSGRPIGRAMRHAAAIRCAAFHPSGDAVLTGSEDGTAQLWDAATGEPLPVTLRHEDEVWCVAFSPDGDEIITGGKDYTARRWNAATGEQLGDDLDHMGRVIGLAFSPDGRIVATASDDGAVRLWSVLTGEKPIHTFYRSSAVECLVFSRDGKFLVAGFRDGAVHGWEVDSGRLQWQLPQQQGAVLTVAVSPDEKRLATGCENGEARLWSTETEQWLGGTLNHPHAVRSVGFASDNVGLVTAADDGRVRIWQLESRGVEPAPTMFPPAVSGTGAPVHFESGGPLRIEHPGHVSSVEFSPQTQMLATVSNDTTVHLWQWAGGKLDLHSAVLGNEEIYSLAFYPHGETILLAGKNGVRFYEIATNVLSDPLPHDGSVWPVGFFPGGDTFYTADHGGTVRLWDAESHQMRSPILKHPATVYAVEVSPDGKLLLTGCEDGIVRLWDARTGKRKQQFFAHEDGVWSVAFHPHRKIVATAGGDAAARLWSLELGRPERLGELKHGDGVWSVQFSPTGETLLTGSWDSTAQLWDVNSCLPKGVPLLHGAGVAEARFDQSGDRLFTASWDGYARIWNVEKPVVDDRARIQLWIEVQTGQRLESSGAEVPLTYEEWRQRRDRLAASGGAPFAGPARE